MSDVKRFQPVYEDSIFELPDGEWVQLSDYDRLEAENKALKAELAALRSMSVTVPDEREAFQQHFGPFTWSNPAYPAHPARRPARWRQQCQSGGGK